MSNRALGSAFEKLVIVAPIGVALSGCTSAEPEPPQDEGAAFERLLEYGSGHPLYDLDSDGRVAGTDFNIFLRHYGGPPGPSLVASDP